VNEPQERTYLEAVLRGEAEPTLRPAATMGRLAELYLQTSDEPNAPEKALVLARAGLSLTAQDDPIHPKLRHVEAMAMRSVASPDEADLGFDGAAANADREAWKIAYEAAPLEAILCAQQWGDWAWDKGFYDQAGEAYSKAHQALTRHVLRHLPDGEARRTFLRSKPFATRGAFALGSTGRAKDAIVLLEAASSLMGQLGYDRSLLRRLAGIRPDLASQLAAAQTNRAGIAEPSGADANANLSQAQRDAERAVASILAEIRQLRGFATLGRLSNWQEVAAAASIKPLVYLVPTEKGSLVLVAATNDDQKITIATAFLEPTWSNILSAAMPFFEAAYGDMKSDARLGLSSLLAWLGANIIAQVRQALEKVGHRDGRCAVMPFGIFTMLPLHASFVTNESRPEYPFLPGELSYAYSARTLLQSHRDGEAATVPGLRALIVDNPEPLPAPFEPLELSDYEANAVARHFPRNTIIKGHDATTSRVMEAFPCADVVHFTCHGAVDRTREYSGVLLLSGGQILTFDQLREQADLRAKLVVLSSCRSGSVAISIEQAVSLPVAFLGAGSRAVIGTLWDADEVATLLFVTKFYELWDGDNVSISEAMGASQIWLMTADATALRAALDPQALRNRAATALAGAAPGDVPFADPWYWAGFFVAGT
jgi:CHAT domain-containing protein